MKILVVHASIQGSTGSIIRSIKDYAFDKGYETIFCYPKTKRNKSIYRKGDIRIGSYLSNFLSKFLAVFCNGELAVNYIHTLILIARIKKVNPDVIHLHNLHSTYLNLPLFFNFLKKSNKKIIWTFHDCWPFTGHCAHYIFIGCEKWKTECRDCKLYNIYPNTKWDNSRYLFSFKKRYFSDVPNMSIVTVSKWLSDQVKMSFLANYNTYVICNGIDTSIFHMRETRFLDERYGIKGKFIMMALATSWSSAKGFDDYIKLSRLLKEDELILLVGLNQDLIGKLPSNIIGISRTENKDELSMLYSRADVILSLSYAETFGLTVIEGMACGTPAVVYNNTAQKDLIVDGTGYLVQTGNVQEVYNKVEIIRKHKKIHFSQNCVNYVKANFTNKIMCESYINLYTK